MPTANDSSLLGVNLLGTLAPDPYSNCAIPSDYGRALAQQQQANLQTDMAREVVALQMQRAASEMAYYQAGLRNAATSQALSLNSIRQRDMMRQRERQQERGQWAHEIMQELQHMQHVRQFVDDDGVTMRGWTSAPPPEPILPEIPLSAYWLPSAQERDCWKWLKEYADEKGMNLRERCRLLRIPWVARLVPLYACGMEMKRAVLMLSSSTFAQTLPSDERAMREWATAVANSGVNAEWMAHNWKHFDTACSMRRISPEDVVVTTALGDVQRHCDYIHQAPVFAKTKGVKSVIADSDRWHAEGLVTINTTDEVRTVDRKGRTVKVEPRVYPPMTYGFDAMLEKHPPRAGDYELHLIRTPAELREEGQEMRHCIYTYKQRLLDKAALIASVRRNGKRWATLHLDTDGRLVQARLQNDALPGKYDRSIIDQLVGELQAVMLGSASPSLLHNLGVADLLPEGWADECWRVADEAVALPPPRPKVNWQKALAAVLFSAEVVVLALLIGSAVQQVLS